MPSSSLPLHHLPVCRAADFRVTFGANEGDALSVADDLVLDDIYTLGKSAALLPLALQPAEDDSFRIADVTGIGTPGAVLHIDCLLGFACPNGLSHEALLLVELDGAGDVAAVYLFPLHALSADIPLHLMSIDRAAARSTFARLGSASFLRGTRLTLASGAQRRIEDLQVGDLLLTRDDGPQPLRWIGQTTLRATGAWAPVRIAAGALHNSAELLLSPDHRLFFHQRRDTLGTGRAEVMVRVRDLIGCEGVSRVAGGFVDCFHLVFDSHQIIFAEGIAAESMLVDRRARPLVPPEVTARLAPTGAIDGFGEVRRLPDGADTVRLLRDATAC